MNKVRIVFSRYNLDAITAASLVVNSFKNDERDHSIECIPYSPTDYSSPTDTQRSDYTFLIGTNMSMGEILQESAVSANFLFINSGENISGAEVYSKAYTSALIFTPNFIHGKEQIGDEVYTKNLSKLTRIALNCIYTIRGDNDKEYSLFKNIITDADSNVDIVLANKITEVIDAVEQYCNFENVDAKVIAIVNKNYDNLVLSAFGGTKVEYFGFQSVSDSLVVETKKDLKQPVQYTFKDHLPRIQKARYFIQTGMTGQLYTDRKKSMVIQTIQIVEEFLYDIIRLASYPYDTVIAYQDTKHNRQWWIYSSDSEKMDSLLKMIPHRISYKDGKLIHLISDLPKLSQ